MITLNLTSPTREEKYTVKDILQKGLDRAGITLDSFKLSLVHTCFYGSKDFFLHVENLRCTESLWSDSVNFKIEGWIPLHATADGKLYVGFGCGCDEKHGGQFPSEAQPDDQNWNLYQLTKIEGELIAWLDKEDTDFVSISKILEDEECSKVLEYIIRDIFVRSTLSDRE